MPCSTTSSLKQLILHSLDLITSPSVLLGIKQVSFANTSFSAELEVTSPFCTTQFKCDVRGLPANVAGALQRNGTQDTVSVHCWAAHGFSFCSAVTQGPLAWGYFIWCGCKLTTVSSSSTVPTGASWHTSSTDEGVSAPVKPPWTL